MNIKPEIGMPVLYWGEHALEPVLCFICRVYQGGVRVDLRLDSCTLTHVSLRPGTGNQNEVAGAHGGFCEFPAWFIRLMTPAQPIWFVDNDPTRHWRNDMPVVTRPFAFPIGGEPFIAFVHPDPNIPDVPRVIPTSQVLG